MGLMILGLSDGRAHLHHSGQPSLEIESILASTPSVIANLPSCYSTQPGVLGTYILYKWENASDQKMHIIWTGPGWSKMYLYYHHGGEGDMYEDGFSMYQKLYHFKRMLLRPLSEISRFMMARMIIVGTCKVKYRMLMSSEQAVSPLHHWVLSTLDGSTFYKWSRLADILLFSGR